MYFSSVFAILLTINVAQCKQFVLRKTLMGESLLKDFNFETYDPTHGVQEYVTRQVLEDNDLLSIDPVSQALTLRTSSKQVEERRKSFRLESKAVYNKGLFVFDIAKMPTGCGNWPAIWMVGPQWPYDGEVDIVEGINSAQKNLFAVHTKEGCTMARSGYTGLLGAAAKDTSKSHICGSFLTSNTGCGVVERDNTSFGKKFNDKNGGHFVFLWHETGLRFWFFSRGKLPADLKRKNPLDFKKWGTPTSYVPASSCNPFEYFKDMKIVINNALCGDWAGGVWRSPQPAFGQSKSCYAMTKLSCEDWVKNHGSSFKNAYFRINSIKLYNWQ